MLSNCGLGEDSWESLGQQGVSNQSVLKEINPEYYLEGLVLKLKLQYFGHLIRRTDLLEKALMLGKHWSQEEKGMTEDEMVGWHHWLNGYEFEQSPADSEGQGSPAGCSSWGCKESDMTQQLNNNNKNYSAMKRRVSWHLWQHGWNLRAFC